MTVRTSDAMSYPLTLCMLQIVTCNCFYDYDITQNTTEDLRARTKYVTYCALLPFLSPVNSAHQDAQVMKILYL